MIKIEVKGHINEDWKDWFDGLSISYDEDYTILSGNVEDESKLHGILNRIRDLNLKLISVTPFDDNITPNNIKEKR